MNRDSLLAVYDRFTGLVEKLPGGLQKPILRELVPIRELFLEQRPSRLMIVGNGSASAQEILGTMGAKGLVTGESDHGWRRYSIAGLGAVDILDARAASPEDFVENGVRFFEPDAVLFYGPDSGTSDWAAAVGRCRLCASSIVAVAAAPSDVFRLQAGLAAEGSIARRVTKVLSPDDLHLDEALCAAMPRPGQLEFARLTGARRAQAHIAGSLLKSFSAVCGVIGAQPIPLADMPVLTTLQTLMVGLVIHTTGRPFSARLVAEFLGALGFNIGAGFVFREGARALARVVPVWGQAVSGFIAGAGTYAIGRAAIAYFIEESPIHETRRIFRRWLPARRDNPELPPPSGQ